MEVFEKYESNVRGYIRSFPTVFTQAKGAQLYDREGVEYIDFFAGAGVLNYGHNNAVLKNAVLGYMAEDGIMHSLDMATEAKEEFIVAFNDIILSPRGLEYKIQFPGPTGTNAVESALKLARKITGRTNIVSFTNAFHGMTVGSLALTGNADKRAGAGMPLNNTAVMPYDGYMDYDVDTLDYFERMLQDKGSGLDKPAAVIVETVQGEGGINVASFEWLKRLRSITQEHDILLIIDDVQMGCGRTGTFFSFEPIGIEPDIVCLSKSISGLGLPMALVLMRPELDIWNPGEHNGTFRGNNLAFVSATKALDYWRDDSFEKKIKHKGNLVLQRLFLMAGTYREVGLRVRGRGLVYGMVVDHDGLAGEVCAKAFKHGLILETAGAGEEVIKLMPPLTIPEDTLERGLDILEQAIDEVTVKNFNIDSRLAA